MVRHRGLGPRDGHPVKALLGLVTFGRLADKLPAKLTPARRPSRPLKAALLFLLVLALVGRGNVASAAPDYAALYTLGAIPSAIPAGQNATIPIVVNNVGAALWNATGPNLVDLSYHWYDASGKAVVWDGQRTALGTDLPAGFGRSLSAVVAAPQSAGIYLLRFALVKEGVAWFDPEPSGHAITIQSAYAAAFSTFSAPTVVSGSSFTVSLTVTNSGAASWNVAGPNPINLAYHWLDVNGTPVVWDGVRTPLGGDLPAGANRVITASVIAPADGGAYNLAFDMVREGVAWFNTSARAVAVVNPATYRVAYALGALSNAYIGESKTIPVTVTNTGNVPWPSKGIGLVDASYHWIDASGKPFVWDGVRTTLPNDVAPGSSVTFQLAVAMPTRIGAYTLQIDLVREGLAWFSALGSTPASLQFQVASGFGAGYGADTMPASITPNAGLPVSIDLQNTGQRTWPSGGQTPVRLSYHVYTASGGLVIWDGERANLPADVPAGVTVRVDLVAYAPPSTGSYTVTLDLVQEGVGWFSDLGVAGKSKPLSVFPGVTIYGKGWGHGVGLSQWGAQGWASGAAGQPLTGEQIVTRYYPGAQITPITNPQNFRVLLSSPSTGCVGRTIYNLAQMRSDGGLSVLIDTQPNRQTILAAAPGQTVRVGVDGNTIYVMDEWSGNIIWSGSTPVVLTQRDGARPTFVAQKGRWYRGDIRFEIIGWSAMRTVNWVNADDYARGSVPSEMLVGWNVEAYKAQAYAARTYAAWKQSTMQAVGYDLRDDTSDQCYGGQSAETESANAAVNATLGRMLTYGGAPIRAYYASSDGGATEGNGCVWNISGSAGGGYSCGPSSPYLSAVPDLADLAAVGPTGPNPHRTWVVTLQSWQIENAVLRSGYNIGAFISLDLTNRGPGGHVIAVRVNGTGGSVWLPADTFLRTRLGLKSTMVRAAPF